MHAVEMKSHAQFGSLCLSFRDARDQMRYPSSSKNGNLIPLVSWVEGIPKLRGAGEMDNFVILPVSLKSQVAVLPDIDMPDMSYKDDLGESHKKSPAAPTSLSIRIEEIVSWLSLKIPKDQTSEGMTKPDAIDALTDPP